MKARGFTLLEVLIAMSLMAFLSIFTTQSIQRALSTKAKVQHTLDLNGQMRESLRLIERDINMAFHHRDFATDLYNKAEQARRAQPPQTPKPTPPPVGTQTPPTQTNPTTAPFKPKEPPPQLTMLVGEEDALNLTTLTRARVFKDEAASTQQKVGYFLKDCRNRKNRTNRSKCLWRRTDPYLDDDVTKGGDEIALLENVESLVFRYLGQDRQDWTDSWNSKDGPPDEKDKFPLAIEVTLTVTEPPGKGARSKPNKVVMQTVAAIRYPNNFKETAGEQAVAPGAQGTPQSNQ